MEIRNNAEALKSFLGVPSTGASETQQMRHAEERVDAAFRGDDATVSHVGARVSESASADGARMEKVTAIQQAIAAGTFSVPTSKVADKVIDSMLGNDLGAKE